MVYYYIKNNRVRETKYKTDLEKTRFNTKDEAKNYLLTKTERKAMSALKKAIKAISDYEDVSSLYGHKKITMDDFPIISRLNTINLYKETGIELDVVNDGCIRGKMVYHFGGDYSKNILEQIFIPWLEIPQKVLKYLIKKNKGEKYGKLN